MIPIHEVFDRDCLSMLHFSRSCHKEMYIPHHLQIGNHVAFFGLDHVFNRKNFKWPHLPHLSNHHCHHKRRTLEVHMPQFMVLCNSINNWSMSYILECCNSMILVAGVGVLEVGTENGLKFQKLGRQGNVTNR